MGWTPAMGTGTLVRRLGEEHTIAVLSRLLAGDIPTVEQAVPPYRQVLLDIGNGHAERLLSNGSGQRLVYWPKVWAARSLAYVGRRDVGPQLRSASCDAHWRVRMTATQTIGRLGIDGLTAALLERLDDDHVRVRAAALLAMERAG
ncbi:MAG: HEAT repeat domain-containing protein, partial [Actinomycetota bacterium]